MRISLLIIVALASSACAQQFGDRIGVPRKSRQNNQNNGYFYPEPSPTFTLPPVKPTPTILPPPPPTQAVIIEQTTPKLDYLPPPTQPPYVQCSLPQECVSAQVCNSRPGGSAFPSRGNCQINGQSGVCCNPVQPTLPPTTTRPPTTTPSYIQCSLPQECISAQACSARGSSSTNNGNCQVGFNGQLGVCCNPPPTTTARPVTVRTTTPGQSYLPPTTGSYNYPQPQEPLQFPESNNNKPFVAPTVRPSVQPVLTAEEEEIAFWDFRESIPGDPEIDYPILDKIPQTSFTCDGKVNGFYADEETRCQVFHVCSIIPQAAPIKSSFLCPNGTLFNQQSFVCQWWPDVNCAQSSQFVSLNNNIGVVPASSATHSNSQTTNSGSFASSNGFQSGAQLSASASAEYIAPPQQYRK